MRLFSLKILAFILLQAAIFFLVWNNDMPRETNYLAAHIDKQNRLRNTPAPRIILVGGSNLAFGIDSDLLEAELGLPVVNMGLVAGLGIEFMLNEVEPRIGPGDIIVLSFEYDLFQGLRNRLIIRQALELRPFSVRFVPAEHWKSLATDHGLNLLGGHVRRSIVFPQAPLAAAGYERRHFDWAGSYIGHHNSADNLASVPPDSPLLSEIEIEPMSERVRQRLARFARTASERGAWCVVSCPPQPDTFSESLAIREILAQVAAIPNIQVIDSPRVQRYPVALFYDTGYHLTQTGAAERTRKLGRALRRSLSDEKIF